MLSCFFQGFCKSLFFSMRSDLQRRLRVACGMMTSSMIASGAGDERIGEAGPVFLGPFGDFVSVADVGTEDDLDRTLRPHHGNFRGRPGEIHITPQVLRAHHVIGAAIGFAGNHRHLRHRRLGIGKQQLGAVFDDAAEFL